MHFDFSTERQLALTMIPYVTEMVQDFTKYDASSRMAKTPASYHLFQVDLDAKPLSHTKKAVFHSFVARALFLVKHARPDITTAVAFLMSRVSKLDENN